MRGEKEGRKTTPARVRARERDRNRARERTKAKRGWSYRGREMRRVRHTREAGGRGVQGISTVANGSIECVCKHFPRAFSPRVRRKFGQ